MLPTPFVIALLLTILTVVLALIFGETNGGNSSLWQIALQWEKGLWNNSLLVFAFQMMLMLVLGHALALSKPVSRLIENLTAYCTNSAKAACIVTFFTAIVGLFNWGLALIFGAILARKVGEYCKDKNLPLNYPLIGASGYVGLLVWHGGMSGSSLLKINEVGHIKSLVSRNKESLMDSISISETIFSNMNIAVGLSLLLLLPIGAYFMGKWTEDKSFELKVVPKENNELSTVEGLEKLTYSNYFGKTLGAIILLIAIFKMVDYSGVFLGFVNPNFINLLLFGLALIMHQSIFKFLGAIQEAISGAAGILIQFPLYFGIMSIMIESNLVTQFSTYLVSNSTDFTYPIFTFFNAAIVNVFVPSGGGQWAIQGPLIIESYLHSGIPLEKSILAMAYGDQLTNMLQPFWALPLLGVTGLKAKEIVPYTLIFFCIALVIFLSALLLF